VSFDYRHVHGIDGLPLPVAERRSPYPAEKIICDAIRRDPENVMIICLGPLTNIARAIVRDPQLPEMIRHIYIAGGTINGGGNITPGAEFNIYADVQAAKTVFSLPCTKTLVPLDVTNPILLTSHHLEKFPDVKTKLGRLLHNMVQPALWTYRQSYGLEGIHIHDLMTYMVAVHPALATTKELSVQIETEGSITRGMTIADQRPMPEWQSNIEVVTKIKTKAALRAIFQGFKRSAKYIEPDYGES
jgi:purine nucleosidase